MSKNEPLSLLRAAYAGAPESALLPLDAIVVDRSIHPRAKVDEHYVQRFVFAIENGDLPPPPTVFLNKGVYLLADGFHRLEAYRLAGHSNVGCHVVTGSRRIAIVRAIHANAQHGRKLNNVEKRRAINTLLDDSENHRLSDSELAEICGCSHMTVGRTRKSHPLTCTSASDGIRQARTKHGTRTSMRTARIGSKQSRRTDAEISTTFPVHEVEPNTAIEDDALPPTADAASVPEQITSRKLNRTDRLNGILSQLTQMTKEDPAEFARALIASANLTARPRFEAFVEWLLRVVETYLAKRDQGLSASSEEVGHDR